MPTTFLNRDVTFNGNLTSFVAPKDIKILDLVWSEVDRLMLTFSFESNIKNHVTYQIVCWPMPVVLNDTYMSRVLFMTVIDEQLYAVSATEMPTDEPTNPKPASRVVGSLGTFRFR
jgi:hypothetical protein